MGHIFVKATVSARRSAVVEFLVDTGATYTIIPPSLARKVGADASPRAFEISLADGTKRRLKGCILGVSIAGRTGPTTALLLAGSAPLLGVETLETLGLKVNPDKQRLEPSRSKAALLVGVRAHASR